MPLFHQGGSELYTILAYRNKMDVVAARSYKYQLKNGMGHSVCLKQKKFKAKSEKKCLARKWTYFFIFQYFICVLCFKPLCVLILALMEMKFTASLENHFKIKFPLQTGLLTGPEPAVNLLSPPVYTLTQLFSLHAKVSIWTIKFPHISASFIYTAWERNMKN